MITSIKDALPNFDDDGEGGEGVNGGDPDHQEDDFSGGGGGEADFDLDPTLNMPAILVPNR